MTYNPVHQINYLTGDVEMVTNTVTLPKMSDLVADILENGTSAANPLMRSADFPDQFVLRYDGLVFGIDKNKRQLTVSLRWQGREVHNFNTYFSLDSADVSSVNLDGLTGYIDVYLNRP